MNTKHFDADRIKHCSRTLDEDELRGIFPRRHRFSCVRIPDSPS